MNRVREFLKALIHDSRAKELLDGEMWVDTDEYDDFLKTHKYNDGFCLNSADG